MNIGAETKYSVLCPTRGSGMFKECLFVLSSKSSLVKEKSVVLADTIEKPKQKQSSDIIEILNNTFKNNFNNRKLF